MITQDCGGQLITGSHRYHVAKEAGIPLPTVTMDDVCREAGLDFQACWREHAEPYGGWITNLSHVVRRLPPEIMRKYGDDAVGVFPRTRHVGLLVRFVRWGDVVEAPESGRGQFGLWVNDRCLCEMPVRNGRAFAPVHPFGEALGFRVSWDEQEQEVRFDGQPVAAPVMWMNGTALAPIRTLADAVELRLTVDEDEGRVMSEGRHPLAEPCVQYSAK